ncbi:MAG: hypothetical protein MZV63_22980 [Marinilabiliales bacterium]|nr:hypothetical protein [Marinilabiliales bacterium]
MWLPDQLPKRPATMHPLMLEARRMLLKWEAGDEQTVSLWHMMNIMGL